eukprot:TRINITY_DN50774_c0_g1_i1.p1 TRINITY_DN50774_c0_g1~~TRINITY_DN50774_c0_g1_i1.p1  ORF type:complete len:177 (+),score=39.71 TRINITY_DN50774_c0_g1_i1:88-618(+)
MSRVFGALVGSLLLIKLHSQYGFLAPGRSLQPAEPRSRRHATEMELPEETRLTLQLPEANYFVELAAEECIKEGCSVETLQHLHSKLMLDEDRIRERVEMLAQQQDSLYFDDLSVEIGLLRLALSRLHRLSSELNAMLGVQNSDFSKELAAYLAFGSKNTGGFLNLKPHYSPFQSA